MDIIRSAYFADMVLVEGQAPVRVRWFRVDKNAELFPGPHVFGSSVWDDPKTTVQVGELTPLPKLWANGMRPAGLWGREENLGTLDAFQSGNGPNPLSDGVSVVSEPVECIWNRTLFFDPTLQEALPGDGFQGRGGIRFMGGVDPGEGEPCTACIDFPDDRLCNCDVPDDFILSVQNVTGASPMNGLTVQMSKNPFVDCLWEGTSDNPFDSLHPFLWQVLNRLDGSAQPWTVQYGVNVLSLDSGQDGEDTATCKPFVLSWDNANCSPAGPFAVVKITATPIGEG